MSKRSRLNRRLEKESKRNFALSILGIIFVLFLLFKFGLPLLINLSIFLSGNKQSLQIPSNSPDFVMAPSLNPLPTATNSAKFTVSGKSVPKATIDFYLNDSLIDKIQVDKNGNFSFDSQFIKGDNKIYIVTKLDDKKSKPSDAIFVFYKDSKPNLTISSPAEGQQFSKDQSEANVSGSTDANVKITINGFWSIVDQSNNFNYKLKLQDGDNTVKIEAVDQAGNKTEKEIKVTYSST